MPLPKFLLNNWSYLRFSFFLLVTFTAINPSESSILDCNNRGNFCSPAKAMPHHDNENKIEPKLLLVNYYSTVIRNATIIDGTGSPATTGDLALINDKIEAIGKINESLVHPNQTVILEANGNYLTPGFIDSHTHDDVSLLSSPQHTIKTFQGATTVVVGNCGFSNYPNGQTNEYVREHLRSLLGNVEERHFSQDFNSFARKLEGNIGINVASLVGHGPLRISIMGYENREANSSEIEEMCALLEKQLLQGAAGMSLGLVYPPSAFAGELELISLAKVVAKYNKILTAHIRGYEGNLHSSVLEFVNILRQSKAKGLLSHLQAAGKPYWNKTITEAIETIQLARDQEGIDIAVDMYPYLAGSSTILQLLPPSALAGGFDEFLDQLDDTDFIISLQNLTEFGKEPGWESKIALIGYENVVVGSVVKKDLKIFEGLSIVDGASLFGISEFDFMLYLIIEDNGQTNVIMFQQAQSDQNKVFQFKLQMIGSDSIPREGGKPHPRGYGSFPRVIGRMVKEDKILTIEEAVRKATSLTADRFGIHDRGTLKVGNKADLLLFDENFLDMATYEDPTLQPTGVVGVWVNGIKIVDDGHGTSSLPGDVIVF